MGTERDKEAKWMDGRRERGAQRAEGKDGKEKGQGEGGYEGKEQSGSS